MLDPSIPPVETMALLNIVSTNTPLSKRLEEGHLGLYILQLTSMVMNM